MVSMIGFSVSLNWISASIVVLGLPQMFWLQGSQFSKRFEKIIIYVENEIISILGGHSCQGRSFLFLSLFFFIIWSNLMGLAPYIFTSTSHIALTLTLALPIWLGRIIWSILHQYNSILAHIVPLGTPTVLIPVIVIIETVSRIIRPGTLAIRLAANIVAGHLLLTLLGNQGTLSIRVVLLIGGLIILVILELAVSCIQAYVFTILRTLYLNELRSPKFNRDNIVNR